MCRLIHESVRWLLSRGRTSDAQKIVEKIAKFNNLGHVPVLTNSDDDLAMKKETYKKKSTEGMSNGESEKGDAEMVDNHVKKSTSTSSLTTVFDLFRKKRLFLNSVNMFCQW